jgi:hypothetical protein
MYHLTSRGNGRETVFCSREDHERFLELLGEAIKKDEVVRIDYR